MKRIIACILAALVFCVMFCIAVNAHEAECEVQRTYATDNCPFCGRICPVWCSGRRVYNGQNMTFPCSNSKPGCVLVLNDYYNHYSCSYCGSVEIDSNGTTHNHGYHTVCHITILCEYAY